MLVRALSPFVTLFLWELYPHIHLGGFLEHTVCVDWELCVTGNGSGNVWTKQGPSSCQGRNRAAYCRAIWPS